MYGRYEFKWFQIISKIIVNPLENVSFSLNFFWKIIWIQLNCYWIHCNKFLKKIFPKKWIHLNEHRKIMKTNHLVSLETRQWSLKNSLEFRLKLLKKIGSYVNVSLLEKKIKSNDNSNNETKWNHVETHLWNWIQLKLADTHTHTHTQMNTNTHPSGFNVFHIIDSSVDTM